jgi:hypothetical protein
MEKKLFNQEDLDNEYKKGWYDGVVAQYKLTQYQLKTLAVKEWLD